MKVKLLRATMIAGTPTSAGTIVDVDKQAGEYLVAVEKAELAVEACEAPIASSILSSLSEILIFVKPKEGVIEKA